MSIMRKSVHIARESTKNDMLQPKMFVQTIKYVLEMGSTRFIKALIETGYLNELYTVKEYKALQKAIVKISEELKLKVFGKDEEIQSTQWLKKTQ